VDFSKHAVSNQLSTGVNFVNPTDRQLTTERSATSVKSAWPSTKVDDLFECLMDLVNPQYKAWYCKRFYALGRDRVLELAALARGDGKDPKKLFSYLLKADVVV